MQRDPRDAVFKFAVNCNRIRPKHQLTRHCSECYDAGPPTAAGVPVVFRPPASACPCALADTPMISNTAIHCKPERAVP